MKQTKETSKQTIVGWETDLGILIPIRVIKKVQWSGNNLVKD